MMIVTAPFNSQLRAQEANEYGNVKIQSLINVPAGHDDFFLRSVSNRPIKWWVWMATYGYKIWARHMWWLQWHFFCCPHRSLYCPLEKGRDDSIDCS